MRKLAHHFRIHFEPYLDVFEIEGSPTHSKGHTLS